ncbi:MAG: VCBS repeat-containing protein [Candidatus Magnetomorum sp.]|nr:VCBS repeat-containing protein [Candidatus Magnetomorum sp.]
MKKAYYLFICIFFIPLTVMADQHVLPTRIGGKLFIDGFQISRITDSGYVIEVRQINGTPFQSSAIDSNGLNRYDCYDINIPMNNTQNDLNKAFSGDIGIIHVYKDDSEISVQSPPGGKFIIGESASIKTINIICGQAPRATPLMVNTDATIIHVKLDAHHSFYADDRNLSFQWEQIYGPEVVLSDPTISDPEFSISDTLSFKQSPIIFSLSITNSFGDTIVDKISVFPESNKQARIAPPQKGLPFADNFATDAFKDPQFTTANWFTFDSTIKLPGLKQSIGAFEPYKRIDPLGVQTHSSYATAIADMDGDGDLDVIIGNRLEINYLYLNNATSNPFANVEPQKIGTEKLYTYDLAIGDVNGDGSLDLVEACSGCANRVYMNNQTLSPFKDVIPIIIDSAEQNDTTSLALGDIDGDQRLDLIVGNQYQTNRLYLNNGTDHPFETAIHITNQNNATKCLALCDIDRDDDLDLIEGNDNYYNAIYLNEGKPDFFREAIYINTNRDHTESVAAGDMNNDGYIDLVVGNLEEADQLYFNTKDSIPFSETNSTTVGDELSQTFSVQLNDLNGDGSIDIITGGIGSNRLYVNNGTANPFENVTAIAITPDYLTKEIAIGDLDGDLDLDMIEANKDQINMVYINNSISGFSFILDQSNRTNTIEFADMDNDGDLDMIEGNYGQINHLFLNNGTADPFKGVSGINVSNNDTNTTSIAIGDVNKDNYPDIICGDYNELNKLYLNSGSPDFFTAPLYIGNTSDKTRGVTLADINGDHYPDLLVGNNGLNYIYYNNAQNESNPFYGVNPVSISLEDDCTNKLIAVDMNTDGYTDIIAVNGFDSPNKLYLNNQNGGFVRTNIDSDNFDTQTIIVYDIDNDNDLDIIAGNYAEYYGKNRLYLNNGDQTFTGKDITPDVTNTQSLALGDINGDLLSDLIIGTYEANNIIYLNTGQDDFLETSSPKIIPSGIHETMDVKLCDIDNDGDLDFIEANSNHMNLLFVNNGDGASFYTTFESVQQNLFQTSAVVTSLEIDTISSGNIPKVVLNATEDLEFNTHIDYYLSNNGGNQYFQVMPGISFIFPTQGNDLRWKAQLNALSTTVTPLLKEISVNIQQMRFCDTFPPLTAIEKNDVNYKISFSLCEYLGDPTFSVVSSKQDIIPDNNIQSGCDGEDCYLMITPQTNIIGETVIMLTVTDETGSAYTQFTLSVEDACPQALSYTYQTPEDTNLTASLHAEGADFRNFFIESQGDKGIAAVTHQSNGDFLFTPHSDMNGKTKFYFKVVNNDCELSITYAEVDIFPVNDPPSFDKGDDLSIYAYGVEYKQTEWAKNIIAGPQEEPDQQQLTFIVEIDDIYKNLFQDNGLPAISPDGTFTCIPKQNIEAVFSASVYLKDTGGTDNGGIDHSEKASVQIHLKKVYHILNVKSENGRIAINGQEFKKPPEYDNILTGQPYDTVIAKTFPEPYPLTLVNQSSVTLKSNPNEGWTFVRWIIDGLTDFNDPVTINMNEDKNIYAEYTNQYTLKINRQGTFGQIKINGQVINLPYEQSYPKDTVLTIEALDQNEWNFITYDGDLHSQQHIEQLTMSSDKQIGVIFEKFLQLSIAGDDTSVKINGVVHPLPYTSLSFNKDDAIQLEPVQKQLFSHWSNDINSQDAVLNFVMDSSKDIYLHLNSFQMVLLKGWNLISIPVFPKDNSRSSLFPDADLSYIFKNGSYIMTDTIPTGLGVWISVPEDKIYTIGGPAFESHTRNINPGWSLIGTIHKESLLTCSDPDSIALVYQFKNGVFNEVQKPHLLIKGYGYFILVTMPCTISLE